MTTLRRKPAAFDLFKFFIFFTLHQRTLKCYKEMCLILHRKKDYIRKLMAISVAQHPESSATKNSMLLEKTKDRCKALMQIKICTIDNKLKKKKKKIGHLLRLG